MPTSRIEHSPLDRRLLWGLVAGISLVAVAVRLGVALASGFQVDDAWITYRYAENLAAGEGFVYNPGERVYGTTTPLLTLLLAGAELAGLPLPAASLGLSLAATVATLLCLTALGRPRIGVAWTVLVVGLVAVAPSHVVWSVSGMETALAIAFLIAAFLAYARGRWTLLGLAAAGAFLTRFDAVVLLVALPVTEGILALASRAGAPGGPQARPTSGAGFLGGPRARPPDGAGKPWRRAAAGRGLLRSAGVFLLATGPWLAFATLYFGSPVPNAVWAKTGLHRLPEAGLSFDRVPGLMRAALDPGLAPFAIELLLAGAGVAVVLARRDRLAVVPVWLGGYAAFLALGQGHVHPWYVAPFHPPLLLVWGVGLAWLARGISRRLARRGEPRSPRLSRPARLAAVLGVVAVAGAVTVPAALAEARVRQVAYEGAHAALGRYLAERTRPGEVVYAWDIGYVGHLTGRPILDFQGIVSPEVIPYNRRGDPAGVLLDFRPAWAVVGLYSRAAVEVLGAPEVWTLYQEVHRNARAGPEDVLRRGRPRPYGAEYVVLRRRDLPAEAEVGRIELAEVDAEGGRENGSGAVSGPPAAFEGSEWRTASPESQGLDPERLARGVERVGALSGARSLLVVRNARIVAERSFAGSGLNRRPHDVKSASKSLLSALVGIALQEGWIDGLDSSVAELLPGYAEGLPPEKRRITLADLLSMSSGLASTSGPHYGAWVATGDWTRAALARPLTARPGAEFAYSTGSSHLVSAILSEAAGEGVLALARERLTGPVGMTIHSWQRSPEGYYFGGNSLAVTPRDLARLGQLYLQEGRWNGRQVVPASWVAESTRRHAEGWPHRYGAYGFLWWLPPDDPWESYAAVGYGGQFLYVVPELRMLLVMTSTIEGKGEEWDRRAFAIFREDVFGSAR